MPRPPRPAPAPGALGRDLPPPPGVTLVEGGADVAVYAGHADGVYVCLFDAGDVDGSTERRVPLDRVTDQAIEMVRAGEMPPHAALALVVDCVRLGRVRPQAQGPTCQPGLAWQLSGALG